MREMLGDGLSVGETERERKKRRRKTGRKESRQDWFQGITLVDAEGEGGVDGGT